MAKYTLLITIIVLLVGCGSDDSQVSGDVQNRAGEQTSHGAEIANKPPDSIPAGGIVIEPPDKNDPKYKPDPRLSGGG